MDRFSNLPQDIKNRIFEWDPTHREQYDWVIHQIQLIPVLGHIQWLRRLGGDSFQRRYFMVFKRMKHTWASWRKDVFYIQDIRQTRWNIYWALKKEV